MLIFDGRSSSEKYGFTQIGEPVPDNITLRDVIESLPKEVFEIDDVKAWNSVVISVVSYALGLVMISNLHGTCSHLLGLGQALLYQGLSEDTTWHPVWEEEFQSSPVMKKAIIFGYGPIRPWMSIAHWLVWHFDLKKFRPNEVKRVKISLACVFAFMAIGWPLIIYKAGIMGWIKNRLMPWLGYHFWMSTFTMIHHTAPHIHFKACESWNASQAQLGGTIHCNYPRCI